MSEKSKVMLLLLLLLVQGPHLESQLPSVLHTFYIRCLVMHPGKFCHVRVRARVCMMYVHV